MDLFNQSLLSGRPVGIRIVWQILLIADILCKHFNQMFLILAVYIGTIDLCHLMPHSVALALDGGHNLIQSKAKPVGFVFTSTSQLIKAQFDVEL